MRTHRQAGADQHEHAGREPKQDEVTSAEQEAKTRLCWRESKGSSKKRCIFLEGELFFLLTGPLMGDPVGLLQILLFFHLFPFDVRCWTLDVGRSSVSSSFPNSL